MNMQEKLNKIEQTFDEYWEKSPLSKKYPKLKSDFYIVYVMGRVDALLFMLEEK